MPNYEAMFAYFITNYGPATTVRYLSSAEALNQTTVPCADMCDCQSCQQSCVFDLDTESGCYTSLWGQNWTCLSVGLTSAYLAFVLIGFAVIVYVFYNRYFGLISSV
jgi:hypothetical protein